ncbi:hypothetical protein [Paraburkholderia dinghuensis]|uniref:Rap1a immunity protein domain-containing protein n=1 Tax=Paraburkholderia dinghuensis TaxID=2305225 RepID=A0A3N6N1K7_9BURK|nr:hypothetical protein [Paraburkholderia dinghuensis]RQH04381.1 hypothetical protein D1Y85_18125 [Paraburkholderia dinghuensis]
MNRAIKQLTVGALAVWVATISNAAPQFESLGHIVDGNTYRGFSSAAKATYVAGVFDGVLVTGAMGDVDESLLRLKQCTMHMTLRQLDTIVDAYIDKNPSQWGDSMSKIVMNAMGEACKDRGIAILPEDG